MIDQSSLLDTSLHYGMDFDLVVRAFLLGNITYYDSLVSKYRIHASSKTNDHFSFVKDWRLVFSRFVNTFPDFSCWHNCLSIMVAFWIINFLFHKSFSFTY